jgi:4'-phosphopantetheinyl transferase
MHWQSVASEQLAAKQTLAAGALHVWWWPESLQPTASTRRLRTDAILRTLLARYLPFDPDALRFGREAKGRPYLLLPEGCMPHADAPDFNLSDTVGGCVIAVSASGRVGIDIERCDRQLPVARLAARWFAPDEADALHALDEDASRRAFLRLWTAKEASCKATGTGIYGRLSTWRFAVDEGEAHPRAIALPPEAGLAEHWRFHRLAPAASHTVALACRDTAAPPQGYAIVD